MATATATDTLAASVNAYIPQPGRSMWKGSIVFGMVTIPVKLYVTTSDQDIHFNTLHGACMARLKQERVCGACGNDPGDDVLKAYEVTQGNYVTLAENELADLPVPSRQTVRIDRFVPAAAIDLRWHEKTYVVLPDPVGLHAYALLQAALRSTDRVGIGKVTIRTKESPAVVRLDPNGNVSLSLLHYAAEMRDVEPVIAPQVLPQELELARMVLEAMSGPFEPEIYRDEYREAVLDLVQAKVSKGQLPKVADNAKPAPSMDVNSALRATLERIQAAKAAAQEPVPINAAPSAKRRRKAAAAD